jgi:predicted membrane channel-forming protein YqfA (hemolysin III family)
MGVGLYIIAGVFFVIWLIEYFGHTAGEEIHIVLVSAIILLLVKTFMHFPSRGRREKILKKSTYENR